MNLIFLRLIRMYLDMLYVSWGKVLYKGGKTVITTFNDVFKLNECMIIYSL